VQQGSGSILREGVSVGEGHRSNMAGYLGMIEAQKTYFSLEDAVSVYSRLDKGEIQGRAVFVPAS
jgi:hypothetical protein